MQESVQRILPAQRLAQLRSLLKSHTAQVIDLNSLAERFNVSVQTIRRDMNILAAEGLVERTFGGAVIQQGGLNVEPDMAHRQQASTRLKDAIATSALELLNPGEPVFIDASTTVLALVQQLPSDLPLDITTTSLTVVQQVSNRISGHLTLLGGDYRSSADCVGGTATVEQASRMRFSTAIMSCRALNIEQGVTEAIAEEAALKRVVISHSERVILLVDSSKIESVSAHHFADLENIDVLVVDDQINPDTLRQVQTRVPYVLVAPTGL